MFNSQDECDYFLELHRNYSNMLRSIFEIKGIENKTNIKENKRMNYSKLLEDILNSENDTWKSRNVTFWKCFDGGDSFINDLTPPENYKETEKEITYTVTIPGFSKEEIKVSLKGNYIVVSKKVKGNFEVAEEFLIRERSLIVTDNISVKLSNGILTITVPKKEEVNINID